MVLRLSSNMVLYLGVFLFFSSILLVTVNGDVSPVLTNQSLEALKKTISLNPDHQYYDSSNFDSQEMAASAVSPFCKSFTFLCHVRCLQRGDPRDAGNFNDALSQDGSTQIKGEVNRCTQIPGSNTIGILCLCNNGVDLTAEVSYALEGVVDIKAAGGNGVGTGEAGLIREVVYIPAKTITEYKTVIVTKTVTVIVTPSPAIVPAKTSQVSIELDRTKQKVGKKLDSKPPSRPVPPKTVKPVTNAAKTTAKLVKQVPKATTPAPTKILPKKSQKTQAGSIGKAAQTSFELDQYLKAGDEHHQELGDWAHSPDSYQEPYLEKEYASGTNDQERAYAEAAEVEAEEIVASNLVQASVHFKPASSQRNEDDEGDDNDDHSDSDDDDDDDTNGASNSDANVGISMEHNEDKGNTDSENQKNRHGRHRYDREEMYPPFDIETAPAFKNIHKNGNSEKKDHLSHQKHQKHKSRPN